MSTKGTSGVIKTSAEYDEIRRAAKRRQQAGRKKMGGLSATGAVTNPHVGTGLSTATARRQALVEEVANRRQTLITRIANDTVSRFCRWAASDDRAVQIWTNSDDVKFASAAVYLAFGEALGDFNEALDMLPKGTTHRSDVRRAVVLAVTDRRNAARLADLGIKLSVESESWFSGTLETMARRRASVEAAK